MKYLVVLFLVLSCLGTALSNDATPMATDQALEARVTKLSEELRCLVCQNQTIADSQAGLAIDLKNQVREQFRQGRNEQEVISFMVQRYGDFVLYRPPLKATTLLLWLGPFVMLFFALWVLLITLKQHRSKGEVNAHDDATHLQAQLLLATKPNDKAS
jgi:cytochrome c-type biogenesis protein CcmH